MPPQQLYSIYFISRLTGCVAVVRTPADANQTYDYVVCAHKAIDQDAAVAQLAPVIDQDRTTIVLIQNGVGNEEPFRKAYPRSTIITCVVRPSSNCYVWQLTD